VSRRLGSIAAWLGALGSVVLVLYAGRHYAHPFVLILFVLWAISPFAMYGMLRRLATRWPSASPPGLDVVIELAAIASLVVYTYAALRPGRAVPFVVVPLVAWALIVIVVLTATMTGRGKA
jgi:hypothetical protein